MNVDNYNNVRWPPWYHKSPTTRLFVEQPDHADNKVNIKASNCERYSPVTVTYPMQRIKGLEIVSMSRRHHECIYTAMMLLFNTLRPRPNGRHLTDDILDAFSWRTILEFVPKCLIDNMLALLQMTAWCRTGGKPSSEAMRIYVTDAIIRHVASIS